VVTRNDVARLAGTSTTVVSYVLNDGPRGVSADARARVLAAVEQLGYRPNRLAAGLRSRRTRVLGLLVPDNSNPFFAQLARAVEEAAFARQHLLLMGNSTQSQDRQVAYLNAFIEQHVDGIILVGAQDDAPGALPADVLASLRTSHTRIVILDRTIAGVDAALIGVENADGAYEATLHLLSHGHNNVAALAGPPNVLLVEERVQGWARALDEVGVPQRQRLLRRSRFDRGAAYTAALHFLRAKRPPTALFAHSDEQAIGVLRAASELNVRIPGDLDMVSFDGVPEGYFTTPRLTTVMQPFAALGERAVESLLAGEGQRGPPTNERLGVRLCIRESCGCARDPTTTQATLEALPSSSSLLGGDDRKLSHTSPARHQSKDTSY